MATSSQHRITFAVALLGALLGCAGAPGPQQSSLIQPNPILQCKADRGMGGTGISASDRGMGGTGVIAFDRGLGGTGIIGTVTGFGSVCVNGFRVGYDNMTPVSVDGLAATAEILERGMTVAVKAVAQSGQLQASTIEVLHALVGPVTTAANAEKMFAVMGVPVEASFAAGAPAASLAMGDIVAIDGLQTQDGTFNATHIMQMPRETRASVRGVVNAAGAPTIGSVQVAVSAALPAAGAWAKASGIWTNGVLQTDNVIAGIEIADAARLSVEGYVFASPAGLTIRGVLLGEDASRGLDRAMLERFAAGQRVQIIGQRQSDGTLRPETVIVPDRLSPLDTGVTTTTSTTVTRTATTEVQAQRGVYGTTVTRPATLREATTVERPAVPTRPAQVIRPEVRPEVRPEIPRPSGTRPTR